MAKVPMKNCFLLFCSCRRWYTVGVESTSRVQTSSSPASAMRKAMDSSTPATGVLVQKKEGGFWMKDPKTGNWIPETHFDDVDVVELREKFLSKNHLL